MGAPRGLTALILVVAGLLAVLFGLFVIAYGGDAPDGEPYFLVGGRKVDADVVGAVTVVLGVAAMLIGWQLMRRSRTT